MCVTYPSKGRRRIDAWGCAGAQVPLAKCCSRSSRRFCKAICKWSIPELTDTRSFCIAVVRERTSYCRNRAKKETAREMRCVVFFEPRSADRLALIVFALIVVHTEYSAALAPKESILTRENLDFILEHRRAGCILKLPSTTNDV